MQADWPGQGAEGGRGVILHQRPAQSPAPRIAYREAPHRSRTAAGVARVSEAHPGLPVTIDAIPGAACGLTRATGLAEAQCQWASSDASAIFGTWSITDAPTQPA